jgi:hypothetical protein
MPTERAARQRRHGLRAALLLVLAFGVPAAAADDPKAKQEPPAAGERETRPAAPVSEPKPDAENESRKPRLFVPSQEVPAGASVAFPADI